jgi:hypothetical protein
MSGDWLVSTTPFLVALVLLLVPGLIVLVCGWGVRRLGVLFLAPAVSTAITAVAAIGASVVGLPWSPLPVVILTLVAAAVAFALRRWVGPESVPRPSATAIVAGVGGLALAAIVISAQLVWAFGAPANISQTFDAIVHLNTVAFAIDTNDASAFHIGATSDIPFYPNGWHSVVALTAEISGAAVPVAVNATNIAVGAVAWPASCIAMAAAFFRDRPAALVSSAALATGFGAFPMLLFYFGVLYPNTMAYAVLPAGVAVVVELCRPASTPARVRTVVLLGVLAAGIGLAHPNAVLALFAIGAALGIAALLTSAVRARRRSTWVTHSAIALAILAAGAVLWRVSRTGYDMSRWGPWQSTAQAFGEALLASPRHYTVTVPISVLIIVGLVTIVRRPRWIPVALPFAVTAFLFVLVSGTAVGNFVREALTNPWYNDSYRLAALLPLGAIPVATLGAITLVDLFASLARRKRLPRVANAVVGVVASLALFAVGAGPNVLRVAADTRGIYALDAGSTLVSADEQRLLDRLPELTEEDALIAGSPWTGTSLAYALAGRDVLEMHIFGNRSPDEVYLDEHFRDIDTDPAVCEAVRATGVDYVLDFGAGNVWNNPAASHDRDGIQDLPPSSALELVASEGDQAKLYRVIGC